METKGLVEGLTLLEMYRGSPGYGIIYVMLGLLAVSLTALSIDYAYMLYLRSRMVSQSQAM